MKSSVIRHPKFNSLITVHSWQVEVLGGDLLAAMILSYLEEETNLRVRSGSKDRSVEIDEETRVVLFGKPTAKKFMDSVSNLLSKEFIYFSTDDNTFQLRARKLNKASDSYHDKKYGIERTVELSPLVIFLMVADLKQFRKKQELSGVSKAKVAQAREIFKFWKIVNKKPRSQDSPKWLKMIIARIDEGYSTDVIAQGCIGILFSDHHQGRTGGTKYDGIKYIVGDSEKLDRMCGIAEQNGYDNTKTRQIWKQFETDPVQFAFKPQAAQSVNTMTGEEFK